MRPRTTPFGLSTIACVLLTALAGTAWSQSIPPLITIDTGSGAPGAVVPLAIRIGNASDVTDLDLTLDLTPAAGGASLPGIDDAKSGDAAVGSSILTDYPGSGKVRVIVHDDIGFVGPGDLAVLPITLPPTALTGTTYSVHVAEAFIVRGTSPRQAVTVTDSQLTVQGTAVSVPPALISQPVTVASGGSGLLKISLGTIAGVSQATFRLSIVSRGVGAAPVTLGDARLDGVNPTLSIDSAPGDGVIDVAVIAEHPIDGPGPFVVVPITVSAVAPPGAVYDLDLSEIAVTGADGRTLPAAVQNSSLTVTPPLAGDFDGNGTIDVRDAERALRIAVGIDPVNASLLTIGDVAPAGHPDGRIDVRDVLRILNRAVGLDTGSWP